MAFDERNGLTVQSAIDTTFLDVAHYDATCVCNVSGFEEISNIAISDVSGLRPFVISDGSLKTPEFTVTAYVTLKQDKLLQDLYMATVHPGYIDERFPIIFMWGDIADNSHPQVSCYLANYSPPDNVNYRSADLLPVRLTLRQI